MISFVGQTSTTSSVVKVPAGVQPGDLLLSFFSYWHAATAATPPSGWTLLETSTSASSGVITVWARFATGTANDVPGANYFWMFSGPGPYEAGGMIAYRGVDPSILDGNCETAGSNTMPTLCSLNTGTDGDRYVGLFAMENTNFLFPGDLSSRVLQQYSNGNFFGVAAGDKALGMAGMVSSDTGSMNSGGWESIALALKPALLGPTATATATPIGVISFVGKTVTSSNQMQVPAGVQNGDLMLAAFSYWSFASATPPSGWTFFQNSVKSGSSQETVWYRIANNDTPGSVYNWSFSGPGPYASGAMLAYRGVDPATPFDNSCLDNGSSTTPTWCQFMTTNTDDQYVAVVATENTGLTSPAPGSWNTQVLIQYLNGSFFGTGIFDMALGSPGAIGPFDSMMNSGGWATVGLALKPGNGSPPPSQPIAFDGSTQTTNNVQHVPPGTQAGDLMLAYYSYWHMNSTVNAAAGWTQLLSEPSASSGVETVWYKFATPTDLNTNPSWSFSGPGPYEAGGMLAYRNVASMNFLDGNCLDEASSTSPDLCAFGTLDNNDVEVGFFATENTNFALNADLTSRGLRQYQNGSFFGAIAADKALGGAGAVAQDVSSMNSGGWESVAIALKHN